MYARSLNIRPIPAAWEVMDYPLQYRLQVGGEGAGKERRGKGSGTVGGGGGGVEEMGGGQ